LSVGSDFYGIFSANNEPDLTHFPNCVNYKGNHDFNKIQLLDTDGVAPVDPSIDPFFLKVSLESVVGFRIAAVLRKNSVQLRNLTNTRGEPSAQPRETADRVKLFRTV
jgi:hypothetical protein